MTRAPRAGDGDSDRRRPSGRGPWVRLAVLGALLLGAAILVRVTGLGRFLDATTLAAAVARARQIPWIAPVFVAVYATAATIGLPALPLTLAGGAVFGTVIGTALNWVGATIGAVGSFLLARALGRDAMVRVLGGRAATVDAFADAHGFLTLLRLRLIPIVPFNAINIGAGVSGVGLRPYIAATALGILPGTAVYTYFAEALLSGAGSAGPARHQAFIQVLVAGGLVVLLSFIPSLARRFARAR